MSTPIRVLILEDRAADAELMLHELRRARFAPDWRRAETESDYVALLNPDLDIILADYSLPQFDALRALNLLQEHGLDIPFIVITGIVSEEAAVECMKQGATDYILKNRLARLGPAVKRGLEDRQLRAERKQAEKALRASEERFRIAAQSVSDVVWQWDIESARLDWYGDIDALLGYGPGQFPRTIEAWEKILHLDDSPRVMAALEAHFKDDRPYREEYRILRKDGSIAHWRDIGTALRDDRGKAYQMVGAIADITKQKQAEGQLRRSEAELKKAQWVSHVGNWIWNIPANRLEWSDEMFRIFGIKKEKFKGDLNEVIERAIHPDDRAAVERANLSVIKDKVPQPLEYRVIWPDGTVRVVWAEAGELILDEAGQPQLLAGTVQDITERKKAEEALGQSVSMLRATLESTADGILVVDNNGRISGFNQQFAKLWRIPQTVLDLGEDEKALAFVLNQLKNPDLFLAKVRELYSQAEAVSYDLLEFKDGRVFERYSQPQKLEGVSVGRVWSFRDITERRRAEAALQKQKHELAQRVNELNCLFGISKLIESPDIIPEEILRRTAELLRASMQYPSIVSARFMLNGKEFITANFREGPWRLSQDIIVHGQQAGRVEMCYLEEPPPCVEGPFLREEVSLIHVVAERLGRWVENRQAEQALQESEERYRTLIENANEAIVVAQDGLLKFANRKTSDMTGYSPQEIVGKPFVEFIHPDDGQMVSDNYARRIRGEEVPEVYTFRIVGKSGMETWVEIHAVSIQWQDRPATLNFLSDISERKRAEEALRKSEHLLKMSLNSLRDAVFILDSQTNKIEECNLIASEIFGYKRSEFLGRTTEFLHVDKTALEDFRKKLFATVAEKGFLHNFEFHMKRRDGEVFPTEHSVFPLRDEKHALTGWVSVVSDITERKQAEDRIQSLMREIEFILGATKTTLDIIDSKFHLRFVDPASSKARGDWPGRKCYDYFMGRRSPCPNCGLTQALRTKEMVVTEVVLLKEGQRPVQVISIPFQDEKGEWLVAEVSVDITERKRTEEALLASREELRSLSARLQSLREEERTYLAREIHDELGQALTALNMDLSWLSNKLPKSQTPLLKKVESMSAVVAATMQTVKRLSSELRPGLLDDLGLVTAMQWQAEEFGKRTWLKMKMTFVPEEMTVERDLSTAIFRIFQELLTNIARHAKATRVEVSLKRKAGALELRVKDNGRGIKKSEIANPHSLGLIGVRERALAFGGRVEIVGIPRKGTRVVVRLPERGKRDDKNPGG